MEEVINKYKWKSFRIGNLVIKIPIVQGGMGVGISLGGLAGAVAKEGGIGVISAAGIGMEEEDFKENYREANIRCLRREIRKAKLLSEGNGAIGVNIMFALSNYEDLVKVSIEEGADIIFVGAGVPSNLPSFLKPDTKTKIVPIVSSGKGARIITTYWQTKYKYTPDAIVIEGPMAGGHLGFKKDQIDKPEYKLENIVDDVLNVVRENEEKTGKRIPIIAGGGVYTGEDIYNLQKQGVAAVQMGTRFVATDECDADLKFKQAYVDCTKEDIEIIESPVGLPGRAIIDDFLKEIKEVKPEDREPLECIYNCIKTCDPGNSPYCITKALVNAKKGNFPEGFAFAGANAYRVDKIVSVHELVEELKEEYEKAAEKDQDKPKILEYKRVK